MSENSSDGSASDDPEIIRRKFTLTPKHDDRLQTIANAHYGGNCSQCLRSAIEDHARTLDGAGETLLRQIADDLEDIQTTIDQLEETIEQSGSAQVSDSSSKNMSGDPQSVSSKELLGGTESFSEEMWTVYRILADAYPEGYSVEDLTDLSPLSTPAARHALIDLEEHRYITSESIDGELRYKITEMGIK